MLDRENVSIRMRRDTSYIGHGLIRFSRDLRFAPGAHLPTSFCRSAE